VVRERATSHRFYLFAVFGHFRASVGLVLGVVEVADGTGITGTVVAVVSGGGFSASRADGIDTVVRPVSDIREVQSFTFQTGGVRVVFESHCSGFGGGLGWFSVSAMCWSRNAMKRWRDSWNTSLRSGATSSGDVANGRGR
jgi:hypothetical protein